MVGTHRATYSSVPQTAQTSPIGWEVTGAGVLRDAVRSPAVLHSEGGIPEASNDPSAARADSPPPIRASGLEAYARWFQTSEGESDEDWDRVKSETESVISTVEGSGHCSPSEASFSSPVAWSTRSPRSLGWETQKRRGKVPPYAASTKGQSMSESFVHSKFFPVWLNLSQNGDDADRVPEDLDRAMEYSIGQKEASCPQLHGISG
ncbi:hypothetical protein C8R46DRAFT_1065711 [Mycena filopes]|nr:hypothetical protein C8R46DRAFT_1065711 [Mycena filopes]